MGIFSPRLGTKYQVQTSPVVDGQFIVATDSRELYYDNGSLRIPLGDIVFIPTEDERLEILAPLPKFYFVVESKLLYVWDGENWQVINDYPFDEYSLPSPGSLPAVLIVRHDKVRYLPLGNDGDVLTVCGEDIKWTKPQYS